MFDLENIRTLGKDVTLDEILLSNGIDFVISKDKFSRITNTPWGKLVHSSNILYPFGEELKLPEVYIKDKIPLSILKSLVVFFDKIYDEYKTEVYALICKDTTKNKIVIHVPKQKVSSARVSFDRSDIPKDYVILANAHSHHEMGAFWSSTDDADDANSPFEIAIVLAKLKNNMPDIKIRIPKGKSFTDLSVFDVFSGWENAMNLNFDLIMKSILDKKVLDINNIVDFSKVSFEPVTYDKDNIQKETVSPYFFNGGRYSKSKNKNKLENSNSVDDWAEYSLLDDAYGYYDGYGGYGGYGYTWSDIDKEEKTEKTDDSTPDVNEEQYEVMIREAIRYIEDILHFPENVVMTEEDKILLKGYIDCFDEILDFFNEEEKAKIMDLIR